MRFLCVLFRGCVSHGCVRYVPFCCALPALRFYSFNIVVCLLRFPLSSRLFCFVVCVFSVPLNSLNMLRLFVCCRFIYIYIVVVFLVVACVLSVFRLVCVCVFGVVAFLSCVFVCCVCVCLCCLIYN